MDAPPVGGSVVAGLKKKEKFKRGKKIKLRRKISRSSIFKSADVKIF